MTRARARVDLDAVRANLARLRAAAGPADVMAVVKADAYGHGMLPVARTARAAGTGWLGVALPAEALALRAAGDTGRILAWLWDPTDPDAAACVAADVDLSVNGPAALAAVVTAARAHGRVARIHLKVDTGLGRNGATPAAWPHLVAAARAAEVEGAVSVVGVWSHLACADVPGHPATAAQTAAFSAALDLATAAGLTPQIRHLASSGAALREPDTHFDLVRTGIALYGISPGPECGTPAELGLRPAMSLLAPVVLTKRVPAGHGVSYGLTWTTPRETTLALVAAGYGDGVPRAASDIGPLQLGGARRHVVGRVAMDQVVVDLGDEDVPPGTDAVLFGPGDDGAPTAADWADACGTIAYEIVTRIGPRVPREYVGDPS